MLLWSQFAGTAKKRNLCLLFFLILIDGSAYAHTELGQGKHSLGGESRRKLQGIAFFTGIGDRPNDERADASQSPALEVDPSTNVDTRQVSPLQETTREPPVPERDSSIDTGTPAPAPEGEGGILETGFDPIITLVAELEFDSESIASDEDSRQALTAGIVEAISSAANVDANDIRVVNVQEDSTIRRVEIDLFDDSIDPAALAAILEDNPGDVFSDPDFQSAYGIPDGTIVEAALPLLFSGENFATPDEEIQSDTVDIDLSEADVELLRVPEPDEEVLDDQDLSRDLDIPPEVETGPVAEQVSGEPDFETDLDMNDAESGMVPQTDFEISLNDVVAPNSQPIEESGLDPESDPVVPEAESEIDFDDEMDPVIPEPKVETKPIDQSTLIPEPELDIADGLDEMIPEPDVELALEGEIDADIPEPESEIELDENLDVMGPEINIADGLEGVFPEPESEIDLDGELFEVTPEPEVEIDLDGEIYGVAPEHESETSLGDKSDAGGPEPESEIDLDDTLDAIAPEPETEIGLDEGLEITLSAPESEISLDAGVDVEIPEPEVEIDLGDELDSIAPEPESEIDLDGEMDVIGPESDVEITSSDVLINTPEPDSEIQLDVGITEAELDLESEFELKSNVVPQPEAESDFAMDSLDVSDQDVSSDGMDMSLPEPEMESVRRTVKVAVRLPDQDFDAVDDEQKEQIKAAARQEIASAAGVDVRDVRIVDVRPGSIIIEAEVTLPPDDKSAKAEERLSILAEDPGSVVTPEFQERFGVVEVTLPGVTIEPQEEEEPLDGIEEGAVDVPESELSRLAPSSEVLFTEDQDMEEIETLPEIVPTGEASMGSPKTDSILLSNVEPAPEAEFEIIDELPDIETSVGETSLSGLDAAPVEELTPESEGLIFDLERDLEKVPVGIPPEAPAGAEVAGTVGFELRFRDADFRDFVGSDNFRDELETFLKTTIAKYAGIQPEDVTIDSIRPGSIIVKTTATLREGQDVDQIIDTIVERSDEVFSESPFGLPEVQTSGGSLLILSGGGVLFLPPPPEFEAVQSPVRATVPATEPEIGPLSVEPGDETVSSLDEEMSPDFESLSLLEESIAPGVERNADLEITEGDGFMVPETESTREPLAEEIDETADIVADLPKAPDAEGALPPVREDNIRNNDDSIVATLVFREVNVTSNKEQENDLREAVLTGMANVNGTEIGTVRITNLTAFPQETVVAVSVGFSSDEDSAAEYLSKFDALPNNPEWVFGDAFGDFSTPEVTFIYPNNEEIRIGTSRSQSAGLQGFVRVILFVMGAGMIFQIIV